MSDIKILIVEDEQLLALDLQKKLEKMGFVVTGIADTGELALSQAEETHPHLVLMDIVIAGDLDGIETAKLVRQRFNIPVIYLTAFNDEETNQRAKLSEPFAYLSKPFNERELKFIIETAIYKHNLERELKESEKKYRILVETLQEGLAIVDSDENIIFANFAFSDILGYSQEEIVGMNLLDFVPGAEFEKILQETKKRERGIASRYELLIRRKDKELRNVNVSASPWINEKGELQGTVGVIMDITERKRAENKLQESEERFRNIAENALEWIWEVDSSGKYTYASPIVEQILGYKPQEVMDKHFYDFFHPEEREELKISAIEVFAQKQPFREFMNRNVHKNGKTVWLSTSGVPVLDERGNLLGYRGADTDITERKQAAMEIEKRQKYLESLLNSIPEAIVTLDSSNCIIEWNPGAEKIFGYCHNDVHGKNIDNLITSPNTIDEAMGFTKQVLSGKEVHTQETIRYRKDGTPVNVIVAGSPIKIRGELQGIVAVYTDISKHKKTEEELLKAEKLESVGILAGGIAHDFNNIMAAILVNVGLAKLSIKKEDKVLEKLNETEKAIIRAKDLTQQLLTFSKGGAPIMRSASLGALLSDTAGFALSGSNVKCDCTVPEDLWDVEIDEGQVNQVIQNLILNAVQAMPDGGTVRIGAENVTIEAGKGLPLKEGRYIRISMKDRGIGIPRNHLGKIFDPFFTTKQKGSGLGLSTAYSIIKNHNGLVTVDSELGKGTVFYIYLPASREKKVEKEKPVPKIAEGEGKILVMDDEDMVLEATQELLREIGYTVEVARDGVEAIKRYEEAEEANQPFDVVILDLIVPGGLGGQETIQRLLEIDPKVKAVVSSGYSTDPVIAKHKEYGFTGAITKPYRIKELSIMLHKVMAG